MDPEVMDRAVLSCPEDNFMWLRFPSIGFRIPSIPSSLMFPEPWRGDADVILKAEDSTVTYSWQSDQLRVSALTARHCNKVKV